MLFNRYMVDLILQIKEKGHVTRKTQSVYNSTLGFFIAMRWLKEHDLIKCDGTDKDNFKIWTLSESGKKVAEHLKAIRQIVRGDK